MLELAQLLDEHWQDYKQANQPHLASVHYRAVDSVLKCRTAALGSSLFQCDYCGKLHFAHHSCNHRNCPQCGALDQLEWAAKQEAKLLPVPYFMVTFTVPEPLRYLFKAHPKELYDLLLKESAKALQDVVATKYNGGKIGCISVLHSWGRQMQHHPHTHCIVPAAVYHADTGEVELAKKQGEFLVHYNPLRDRFRSRFYTALETQHPDIFKQLSIEARQSLSPEQKWNVNLKAVGKGKTAVRYLAKYVQQSAFHRSRLLGYDKQGRVRLSWKCSKTKKWRVLHLEPDEFIRRWLQHVLPKGFMRVRHYGFLASAAGKTREKVRISLDAGEEPPVEIPTLEPFKCEHCEKGTLVYLFEVAPIIQAAIRGPPLTLKKK